MALEFKTTREAVADKRGHKLVMAKIDEYLKLDGRVAERNRDDVRNDIIMRWYEHNTPIRGKWEGLLFISVQHFVTDLHRKEEENEDPITLFCDRPRRFDNDNDGHDECYDDYAAPEDENAMARLSDFERRLIRLREAKFERALARILAGQSCSELHLSLCLAVGVRDEYDIDVGNDRVLDMCFVQQLSTPRWVRLYVIKMKREQHSNREIARMMKVTHGVSISDKTVGKIITQWNEWFNAFTTKVTADWEAKLNPERQAWLQGIHDALIVACDAELKRAMERL